MPRFNLTVAAYMPKTGLPGLIDRIEANTKPSFSFRPSHKPNLGRASSSISSQNINHISQWRGYTVVLIRFIPLRNLIHWEVCHGPACAVYP